MSSAIFSENKNVRIWIDEDAPFVFTEVRRFPRSKAELSALNVKKVDTIRFQYQKYHAAYSIFDAREAEEFDSQMLVNYCEECLTGQYQAGLQYKAFLRPENPVVSTSLVAMVTSLPGDRAGMFDTFEAALEYVVGLWNDYEAPNN